MTASPALQVAYLGPQGSFTHQAARQLFPSTTTHTLSPHPDFPSIFTALQSGAVTYAVLPIENSTNGFVYPVLDLLGLHALAQPPPAIIAETHVPIRQSLLGSPATRSLADIRTVYSHPQAWGQCVPFLLRHLRAAEQIDATSTSRAAELVAELARKGESGAAAIAGPIAADIYGLAVLEEDVAERRDNTTRFLVLTAAGRTALGTRGMPSASGAEVEAGAEGTAGCKTFITMTISHAQPSALANALAVFGRHGINLTSLNSRPRKDSKWQYIFFAEFWGHERDENVAAALKDLDEVVESSHFLGSWRSGVEKAA